MPQITVKHSHIHQAPRKVRLIGDMVRGLPAQRAVAELALLPHRAGDTIRKVILSAIAAAKQQGMNVDNLFVSQIMINEGSKIRRFQFMSRGRSQRILKRMSHLIVSVSDEPVAIASSRVYKSELTGTAAKPAKKQVRKTAAKQPATVAQAEEGSK